MYFSEGYLLSLAAFELLINRLKAFEMRRDKGILKATLHLRIIMSLKQSEWPAVQVWTQEAKSIARKKRESETQKPLDPFGRLKSQVQQTVKLQFSLERRMAEKQSKKVRVMHICVHPPFMLSTLTFLLWDCQ